VEFSLAHKVVFFKAQINYSIHDRKLTVKKPKKKTYRDTASTR